MLRERCKRKSNQTTQGDGSKPADTSQVKGSLMMNNHLLTVHYILSLKIIRVSDYSFSGLLKNYFSNKVNRTHRPAQINLTASSIVKLNEYLTDCREYPLSVDVLEFWKNHECIELRQITQELLIIPAVLVASERDCSAAEYTINKCGARLLPERVKKIIYLNRNLKFVPKAGIA